MAAVKSCGNVFADLDFDSQEAASLKQHSQLMIEVETDLAEKKLIRLPAANELRISQPRISDLKRGKAYKWITPLSGVLK